MSTQEQFDELFRAIDRLMWALMTNPYYVVVVSFTLGIVVTVLIYTVCGVR